MTRSRPHPTGGARRLAPASSGAVLAALVELLGSAQAGEPRLRIEPWSADLAPPVYVSADSMHARRRAPDTLGVRDHEPLEAGFATSPRLVDGQLDDWRLVRWYELTGASALFRGAWTGPLDYGLRFALCWTRDGLLLGGQFSDDDPHIFRPAHGSGSGRE